MPVKAMVNVSIDAAHEFEHPMQLVGLFSKLKPRPQRFGKPCQLFPASALLHGKHAGNAAQRSSVTQWPNALHDTDRAMLGGVLAELLLERMLLHDPIRGGSGQPPRDDQAQPAADADGGGGGSGSQVSLEDIYGYLKNTSHHL